MGLKDRLSRLTKAARDNLDHIELVDGSRAYFDVEQAQAEIFLHGAACLRAQAAGEPFPLPPEVVKLVLCAKDRRAATNTIWQEGTFLFNPYDRDAIIERGVLESRSLISTDEPVGDLSE